MASHQKRASSFRVRREHNVTTVYLRQRGRRRVTSSPREWHLGIAYIKVLWVKRKLVAAH